MEKGTILVKLNNPTLDDHLLKRAASILANNGLVVVPTETVYGLAGNAFSEESAINIFNAKGRPTDNPLIVHCDGIDMAKSICKEFGERAELLAKRFWPGPLTLVLKRNDLIPRVVCAGLDTVAIRVPDSEVMLSLIGHCKFPLAAPSANTSGKSSPVSGEHVVEDMLGKVDMILWGERARVGLESTIVDLSRDKVYILRPGKISKEELEEALGETVLFSKSKEALAPGMKYTHYMPKAPLKLFLRKEALIDELSRLDQSLKIGIMGSSELISQIDGHYGISLGNIEDYEEIARNLFYVMRSFDHLQVDIILAEGYSRVGIGEAIMNRLTKAASIIVE